MNKPPCPAHGDFDGWMCPECWGGAGRQIQQLELRLIMLQRASVEADALRFTGSYPEAYGYLREAVSVAVGGRS